MKRSLSDNNDDERSCKETRQDNSRIEETVTATSTASLNVDERNEMGPDGQRTRLFEDFDKERGLYEPDLLYESDWKFRWDKCKKNLGHHLFIPRLDFGMECLPEHVQHHEFLNYFKYTADLTCYLAMTYISQDRPDKFPFSAYRGKKYNMVGTGMVLPHFSKVHTDEPCICETCQSSSDTHRVWAELQVYTVAHNVCDDQEAKNTRVDLFYDTEEDGNAVGVHSLVVVGVVGSHVDRDWCVLRCVTHDIELHNTIRDMMNRWEDARVKAWKKYGEMVELGDWPGGNVCVIPSHPHGSYKHVTVGHVEHALKIEDEGEEDEEEEDEEGEEEGETEEKTDIWHCLEYRTCTCPGSSGSPVVFMGEIDRMLSRQNGDVVPLVCGRDRVDAMKFSYIPFPLHSVATISGLNKSGVGWFW